MEPLRFVRVESCEVIWRNVYNDPAIPDLRLNYTGANPISAGTTPSTVFMVTWTIKDGYLVSARLENGSYSAWDPPFTFEPRPKPKPESPSQKGAWTSPNEKPRW
jgi:hypothetical protein